MSVLGQQISFLLVAIVSLGVPLLTLGCGGQPSTQKQSSEWYLSSESKNIPRYSEWESNLGKPKVLNEVTFLRLRYFADEHFIAEWGFHPQRVFFADGLIEVEGKALVVMPSWRPPSQSFQFLFWFQSGSKENKGKRPVYFYKFANGEWEYVMTTWLDGTNHDEQPFFDLTSEFGRLLLEQFVQHGGTQEELEKYIPKFVGTQ